ncbi:MAG TPA: choice-of-anchor tandem repeat NxxGxxAF-containing protein [Armatimonadota bacterium]|nr:choice-of-anchor tandem repeat NxxGxxAF-containing protein [Armatimonadota bacterium]
MTRRLNAVLAFLAALILLGLGTPARAQGYKITRIARLPTGSNPLDYGAPAINDRGQVAFGTVLRGVEGYFRRDGRRIRLIGTATDPQRHIFGNPSINEEGEVAFGEGGNEGWSAIYRGSGGQPTKIADARGEFSSLSSPSINDRGDVAFYAQLDDFREGIFLASGGNVTPVHVTEDHLDSVVAPMINNNGEIAFQQFFTDVVQQDLREVIALHTESGLLTVADTAGPFFFLRSPSLNNAGTVAFTALTDDERFGIFTGRGEPLTTVVDSTQGFQGFEDRVSINDSGHVAFTGGPGGLFLDNGTEIIPVLRNQDRLGRARVEVVSIGREALNNQGQIVFVAMLSNRQVGVYVATPRRPRRG